MKTVSHWQPRSYPTASWYALAHNELTHRDEPPSDLTQSHLPNQIVNSDGIGQVILVCED
jgi:hypothetical protein